MTECTRRDRPRTPAEGEVAAAASDLAAHAGHSDAAGVIFYGPTFDALGGGEVWLNRISNGLARSGRCVAVVGKQRPLSPVAHVWEPGVRTDYLEDALPTQRLRHGFLASATRVALAPIRAVSLRTVDVLLRGWRPKGAFTRDISEIAYRRLLAMIDETTQVMPASRVVLICTDVYTGSHLARAKREGAVKVPFYVMHHNSFDSISRGTLRAYRSAAEAAEGLIVLTDEDGEKFRRAGVARTITMTNPRPEVSYSTMPPRSPGVVVWMARMTSVKAGDVALRAWALVAADFPDWNLHLYGDGPERPNLEKLATRLHIRESVRFCGVTDKPLEVLAGASISLLTSRFEGWPLVIAEAAAQCVPTIASDSAPGVRAQITNGVDGLLTAVGDVKGTARALAVMMADEGRRVAMGQLAKERSAVFSLETVTKRWGLLLDDRLQRGEERAPLRS